MCCYAVKCTIGLTIHYTVEFDGTKKQLQKKLEKIRQSCRDLPFEQVKEVETVRITKDIIKIWNFLQEMIAHPNNSIDNMAMRDLIMEKLGVSTWKMVELGEWKEEGNACWKVTRPTGLPPFLVHVL